MVSLLRNTQRRLWHLGWFVYMSLCVYMVNWITTPCLAKKLRSALPRLGPQSSWAHSNRRTPKQRLPSWAASQLDLKRVYASQHTFHSGGLRAICLGLSLWSKFAPFCYARVSSRFCQANASRPACMTSLSFAVHNTFQGSHASSHLFWLPSASVVNFNHFIFLPSVLVKSHSEASHTIS